MASVNGADNGFPEEKIVIVDTGCANISSVKFAVQRLGFAVTVTDDISLIQQADKVILPGVGSAKHAMKNIIAKGLTETLQSLKQPVLGFCLGMQLMTESSTEVGIESPLEGDQAPSVEKIPCLAMIPTKIVPLKANGNRLPHMGWNTLTAVSEHPIFSGINIGDYFYFVHSFAAPVSEFTIASCQYGTDFSAAIAKDNFIGCQFHPERSGKLGGKIINNFLTLPAEKLIIKEVKS
jgi:glutamine amidotransferase